MEAGSPWSTPTQSEIADAEFQLRYLSDVDLKLRSDQELMIREMGDGEPSDETFLEGPRDNFDDGIFPEEKHRGSSKSKSPAPGAKVRSPTKGKFSETSRTKDKVLRQQSMPQEVSSPQKTRGRLARQQSEQQESTNGVEAKSGTSTARTDRTSATDTTFSSSSSGNAAPRSPSKSPSKSPTRSPSKRGSRARARDVLQLPKPYSLIKSDMVKRWNIHYEKGTSPPDDDEKESQLFKSIEYTHALVLKVNQLSKQGLLDRKSCFKFACNVARYAIPDHDVPKCMSSFYGYARELTNIRESIKTLEQKSMFDLEQSGWIPPTFPKPYIPQTFVTRPATSKPRDPDSYDFKDEQLAKDYRKMYEKFHQMEALLKQKSINEE